MELYGDSNQWKVSFSKEAHDWEVNVFASFFQVLHSVIVRRSSEDRLWWSLPKNVCLTSSPLAPWLALMVDTSLERESVADSCSFEGSFFARSTALGKILTLDNLRKRHIIMVDRCCLCKRNGELVVTFFFTAMWLPLCGVLCLLALVRCG
jgi:hypothetical protein